MESIKVIDRVCVIDVQITAYRSQSEQLAQIINRPSDPEVLLDSRAVTTRQSVNISLAVEDVALLGAISCSSDRRP